MIDSNIAYNNMILTRCTRSVSYTTLNTNKSFYFTTKSIRYRIDISFGFQMA